MSTLRRRWFLIVLVVTEAVFIPRPDPSVFKLFPSSSAGPDRREGEDDDEEDAYDPAAHSQQVLAGEDVGRQVVLVVRSEYVYGTRILQGVRRSQITHDHIILQNEIVPILEREPEAAAFPNSALEKMVSSEMHGIAADSVHQSADGGAVFPTTSLELENRVAAKERVQQKEKDETGRPVKFAYVAAGISGASLLGILSGYLGDQTGQFRSNYVKLYVGFLMVAFVSALSLPVIAAAECFHFAVRIQIVRILEWMTLGSLACAAVDVSVLFLEGYAALPIIPVVFVIGVGFLLEARK